MGLKSQIKIGFSVLLALFLLCGALPARSDGREGLKTVCIDAGHGGHDPGCVSADKKTKEKDLALSIALKLAAEIRQENPEVKIVMTRSTDTYVTLNGRADIANKAGADLFISIHINAATNRNANGFSIHCLGQSRDKNRDLFSSNMEMVKRENSVILLEDDYSSKYQGFNPDDPESFIFFNLMQNAHLGQSLVFAEEAAKALQDGPVSRSRGISQDPFLVLWRTAMPAVLVECGFMSNAGDLAAMKTEAGQRRIAHQLYVAFRSFKKTYDSSVGGQAAPDEKKPEAQAGRQDAANMQPPAEKEADGPAVGETVSEPVGTGVRYGAQVLASAKTMKEKDPFFKGYAFTAVWTGKLYKYIIGVSEDLREAQAEMKKIKKDFPDSFLVKIEGNDTEIIR